MRETAPIDALSATDEGSAQEMMVYAFRGGRVGSSRTSSFCSTAGVIEHCSRFKDEWLKQHEFFLEDLPAGASEVAETQLIIRPRHGISVRRKHTHTLAKREKSEPDSVFIAVLSWDQYKQLDANANAEWAKRDTETRQRVKEMRPAASRRVMWKDLSPELQRLVIPPISDDVCWYKFHPDPKTPARRWQRYLDALEAHRTDPWNSPRPKEPAAPYHEFYARTKGSTLPGVLLRHKCDNRLCMNPNHLVPGTYKDNGRDRRRPRLRARARARAIRRFFASAP